MAAHQAPLFLGFSWQEHYSGFPFPSPVHESEKWKWSRSVVSDSSDPMDCSLPGSSIHWIFQAKLLEWGANAFSDREISFPYFSWAGEMMTLVDCVRSDQSLSRVRLCDPMNRRTPGLPVHHQLLEFTQTHVHRVSDSIQPSHPLSSPSPPAPNPSQHQSLFQWVKSLHEVAKGLEFQL